MAKITKKMKKEIEAQQVLHYKLHQSKVFPVEMQKDGTLKFLKGKVA